MCHFWLDPKVTKRSRLTLTGYFETYARCRIPTRFAQTGMLRALAAVSSLDARPLRPSEGKRSFPLILTVISLFIIHYSLLIIMKKSVWSTIIKVIIAVATAIAGALGIQSCIL